MKITYVHIPVPFEAPGVSHLNAFINVMRAFPDQTVWMHCVVNYQGLALLYQYYRFVHGVTMHGAEKIMYPMWQPNAMWWEFMALSKEDIGL